MYGSSAKTCPPPLSGRKIVMRKTEQKSPHMEKRQQKGVHANSGFCLRGTIAPPPFESYNFLNFLRGGEGD